MECSKSRCSQYEMLLFVLFSNYNIRSPIRRMRMFWRWDKFEIRIRLTTDLKFSSKAPSCMHEEMFPRVWDVFKFGNHDVQTRIAFQVSMHCEKSFEYFSNERRHRNRGVGKLGTMEHRNMIFLVANHSRNTFSKMGLLVLNFES